MDQGVIRKLRHLYKSRVLSRIVLCSESGKSHAVYLRSAISMLVDLWKAVTQEILRNCFRHTGFTLDTETAGSPRLDSVCDELPSADVAFGNLRAASVSIPARITIDGFDDADKDLEPCAELTGITIEGFADTDRDLELCAELTKLRRIPSILTAITKSHCLYS